MSSAEFQISNDGTCEANTLGTAVFRNIDIYVVPEEEKPAKCRLQAANKMIVRFMPNSRSLISITTP
jgi:hypothetical protein